MDIRQHQKQNQKPAGQMPNPEALCLQSGLHNMIWALKTLDSPPPFFLASSPK